MHVVADAGAVGRRVVAAEHGERLALPGGHLLTIAHDAGFAPKVAFETEDYVAVQGFVAAGLGVALIPDLIRAATSNPDVSIRPLDPQSRRRIHVVTTDDLLKVPAVAATLEALTVSAQAVDVSVVS